VLRYTSDRARPGLVALYDIWPGNGAGQFLQPRSPHGAIVCKSEPLNKGVSCIKFGRTFGRTVAWNLWSGAVVNFWITCDTVLNYHRSVSLPRYQSRNNRHKTTRKSVR